MNLSRLRLVTFDVTETLLKFRSSPGKQYGEIGAMYGVLCDNNSLATNFRAHWYKMNKEHPNFGLHTGLGWERWWKMIVIGTFKDAKFHVDDKKLDAIATHLIEAYKTSACWQQCYGALDLLQYLHGKGLTVGVISNFDPRLNVTLENVKLHDHFHFVLASYEVGYEKPDPRIFKEAMRASGLKDLGPEECLHVGNTAAIDYVGARNSGWHSFLVHDRNPVQMKQRYGFVDPDHVFSSLYDLHRHFIRLNDGEHRIIADDEDFAVETRNL